MQFTAAQIADILEGSIDGDPQVLVSDLAKIEEARTGTLTFLANPKYTEFIYTTKATIAVVDQSFDPSRPIPKSLTLIRVEDARLAFTHLLELQSGLRYNKQGIEQPSFVSPSARLGNGVYIGAFCYIGDEVEIGAGVKIFPNSYVGDRTRIGAGTRINPGVKIYDQMVIGKNCIIHSGAVIGADGFGFAPDKSGVYEKMPQVGNVILADNVEVGANTTIDRATIGSTIIGRGTKLDNLIQVGHNAEIGEHCVVVAQTGIAGSSKIGDHCQIGGQVGIAGHLHIGDRVRIAAQSGVGANIEEGATIQGSPAFNIGEYKRSYVIYRNLPDLKKKVEQLEKELTDLRTGSVSE
ncbi:MAG: UDP-3-O-(3-hydroxymyristoyl)glucosamine N-acyltransferase [Bacteroidota bacterium]|nr:UDP-3-O-(3-hydroxymyristoyl)glucosamine N-acyltransferase [Bacteroidota bacterium]